MRENSIECVQCTYLQAQSDDQRTVQQLSTHSHIVVGQPATGQRRCAQANAVRRQRTGVTENAAKQVITIAVIIGLFYVFLLAVICTKSNSFSIFDPVIFFGRKFHNNKWLSNKRERLMCLKNTKKSPVPPVTIS